MNVCFVKILVGFFRKYLDSYVLYALRTYFIATAFSANPKEVAKPAKQGRSPNPKMRKRYCEDKFLNGILARTTVLGVIRGFE